MAISSGMVEVVKKRFLFFREKTWNGIILWDELQTACFLSAADVLNFKDLFKRVSDGAYAVFSGSSGFAVVSGESGISVIEWLQRFEKMPDWIVSVAGDRLEIYDCAKMDLQRAVNLSGSVGKRAARRSSRRPVTR